MCAFAVEVGWNTAARVDDDHGLSVEELELSRFHLNPTDFRSALFLDGSRFRPQDRGMDPSWPPLLPIPVDDLGPLLAQGGRRIDVATLLRGEGGAGQDLGPCIGLADCFRLLRRLAVTEGEETFALSARPMVKGAAEFVLSRAAGAATVGEGLRQIASGYNVLHGDDYNRVERRASQLVYAIHDDAFPYTRPRDGYLNFSLECALIFLHAAACELAQADLSGRVVRVSTRRPDPSGPGAAALAFWRAPMAFGARAYGVAYDAGVDELPVRGLRQGPAADLAVHNRILALIEQPAGDAADRRLAHAVRQALQAGAIDQEAVAQQLGMSVATLRRHLAQEDTSFRAIHRQVMNDYARARILETRDIATVAEELGFSDPRAFTRAFKDWNGMTPTDYRTRQPAGQNEDG
jgi:AraC-like DNA-binding protein